MSMHSQIPFAFDDNDGEVDDLNYFPFSEVTKPELPNILTPRNNVTFAKALIAFLMANFLINEQISKSSDDLLHQLSESLSFTSEQKTLTVNKLNVFNETNIWSLKQYIDYININTCNSLKFMNRTSHQIEELVWVFHLQM